MTHETNTRQDESKTTRSGGNESSLIDSLSTDDIDLQLRQLANDNVRFIVVHKSFLASDTSVDTTAYDIRCRRLYADADKIIYVVP